MSASLTMRGHSPIEKFGWESHVDGKEEASEEEATVELRVVSNSIFEKSVLVALQISVSTEGSSDDGTAESCDCWRLATWALVRRQIGEQTVTFDAESFEQSHELDIFKLPRSGRTML